MHGSQTVDGLLLFRAHVVMLAADFFGNDADGRILILGGVGWPSDG